MLGMLEEEVSSLVSLLSVVEVSLEETSDVDALESLDETAELSELVGKTQPLSNAAKERKVAILMFWRGFIRDAGWFYVTLSNQAMGAISSN